MTQHKDQQYPASSIGVTHRSKSIYSRPPDHAISGQMPTPPDYQLIQPIPCSSDGAQATHQVAVSETAPHTHNEQPI